MQNAARMRGRRGVTMPTGTRFVEVAHRRWPDAYEIVGRGPLALVAPCRVLHVELYADEAAAAARKAEFDRHGCSPGCGGPDRHVVEDLRKWREGGAAK
jgi:hypothetical protein